MGSSLPRGHHGCAQYGDGKVLIAGGGTGKNETRYLLDSVEVNNGIHYQIYSYSLENNNDM